MTEFGTHSFNRRYPSLEGGPGGKTELQKGQNTPRKLSSTIVAFFFGSFLPIEWLFFKCTFPSCYINKFALVSLSLSSKRPPCRRTVNFFFMPGLLYCLMSQVSAHISSWRLENIPYGAFPAS